MSVGSIVRRAFGPFEHQVADAWRSIYLDLDDYAEQLRDFAVEPARILEVGGGEGAVTEVLANIFPQAEILSIDIIPHGGRLYRGRKSGVEFRQVTVQEIAATNPGAFDLVMLSDVVHHIPHDLRAEVIESASRCVAQGGRLILKDWERTRTPIHWLCYASDRYLTGDRVAYLTPDEMKALVAASAPVLTPVQQKTIGPWSNNYAMAFECA